MAGHRRVGTYFAIGIGLTFLIVAPLIVYLVNSDMKKQALAEAESKARLLLDKNLAIHTYFTKDLKPRLFDQLAPQKSPDYFDPSWMSSTHAVRKMDAYFHQFNAEPYYYKESAVNARSPENEADAFEKTFLKDLAANPELTQRVAIRVFDGKPFLTVLRRGEVMEDTCLRCHSAPNEAPGDLVRHYGPERSFNRHPGEVADVISMKIPLAAAYANANQFSLHLSGALIGILLGIFGLFTALGKRYFLNPLAKIRDQATRIATDPVRLGEQIVDPTGKELRDLVAAFNAMSLSLKHEHEHLDERVRERTAELEQAKEELEREIIDRKNIEKALKESEARYRTLFETAADAIYIFDAEPDKARRIISANPAAAEMHGYTSDELLTCNLADLETPETTARVPEGHERLLRGERIRGEVTHKRKDGTVFPLEVNAELMVVGGHKYILAIDRDITERKRAENELRRNEARLQSLFDISTFKARNVQDLLDFALEQAIQLTGSKVGYIYHYDEQKQIFVLNTWSKDVMKECEVAQPQTVYELAKTGIWGEVVRQRKPIIVNDFQAPHPLKKGYPTGHVELYRYMTIPVLRNERIVATVGVANKQSDYDASDVRELSLMMDSVWRIVQARQLEEVQRRLSTAIEQAAEGVIIADAEGIIQYVNPAVEQITGFDKEELLGKTPRVFKSGEHDRAFYRQLWDTIKAGNTWSGRFVNKRRDGRLFHEDATISPVRSASGEITNFVAVKRDITEHLELSRQLLQAQKMEAVGTLAGGVAHDFNNLLQVVLGYSELMITDEHLPEEYSADLRKINQAARNGADLVQGLLAFGRKTDLRPLSLNLNRRIEQLQKMLSRTIPKMIQIELELADDLAAISADPTQVDQILMNLAVNARDAMPEGGRLIIESHNVTLDEYYCKTHLLDNPGSYVLLSVSDTGQGMDKETVQHIFEPFFTTKGPGEGTGLGLSIVYGIVKQHGGHITCYSELAKGTTFKLYFPALASNDVHEATEKRKAPHGGSETILLVDDEAHIRDIGSRILTRAGYRVLTASNGKEALAVYQARRNEISLIVLDLIMAEMGGAQCLAELLQVNPSVKVVIASGYSANGATKEALSSGAKGFVTKPYDMRQVLEVVRTVLDEDRHAPEVLD